MKSRHTVAKGDPVVIEQRASGIIVDLREGAASLAVEAASSLKGRLQITGIAEDVEHESGRAAARKTSTAMHAVPGSDTRYMRKLPTDQTGVLEKPGVLNDRQPFLPAADPVHQRAP